MEMNIDVLKGKSILIVEDEKFIAKQIKKLLADSTCNEIQMADSIEKAIEKININEIFDIIIVDIMIPESNKDVLIILENEKKLTVIRNEFDELNLLVQNDETKRKILDKRIERSVILKEIDGLIDKEGGINLIKIINTNHFEKKPKSCIFLSAFGNEDLIKKGIGTADTNSLWLVKPVTNKVIIDSCQLLLERMC